MAAMVEAVRPFCLTLEQVILALQALDTPEHLLMFLALIREIQLRIIPARDAKI